MLSVYSMYWDIAKNKSNSPLLGALTLGKQMINKHPKKTSNNHSAVIQVIMTENNGGGITLSEGTFKLELQGKKYLVI